MTILSFVLGVLATLGLGLWSWAFFEAGRRIGWEQAVKNHERGENRGCEWAPLGERSESGTG